MLAQALPFISENEFSVVQYFDDGTHEYVRKHVPAQEAADAFGHYTASVAAKMGAVRRVIITDGDDCINMEWQFGKGIIFGLEK